MALAQARCYCSPADVSAALACHLDKVRAVSAASWIWAVSRAPAWPRGVNSAHAHWLAGGHWHPRCITLCRASLVQGLSQRHRRCMQRRAHTL
eukprot:8265361-Alexandrium_andersonii.AAC.1